VVVKDIFENFMENAFKDAFGKAGELLGDTGLALAILERRDKPGGGAIFSQRMIRVADEADMIATLRAEADRLEAGQKP
jgi:hypothetical protein